MQTSIAVLTAFSMLVYIAYTDVSLSLYFTRTPLICCLICLKGKIKSLMKITFTVYVFSLLVYLPLVYLSNILVKCTFILISLLITFVLSA